MLDLRHYRYFLAVAEELHFGRAAERLGIAQPALSIQVRKLEEMLGGPLFRRTQRSVELTEAARLLLPQARALLEQADRVERRVRRSLAGDVGRVNLGFSSLAVLSGLLSAVVDGIRADAPDLDIQITEHDPYSLVAGVQSGQLHLGLSTATGVTLPDTITNTVCDRWPLQVILPRNHVLAGKSLLEIGDLEGEKLIVYRFSPENDGMQVVLSLGGFHPSEVQTVTSPMMVGPLVASGFGVSIVPEPVALCSANPNTVAITLKGDAAQMDCSLFCRKTGNEPFATKAIAAARAAVRAWQVSKA